MSKNNLKLNSKKEKIFRSILILLPFALLLLFEIFLRVIGYGPNLNLFVTLENNPRYYKINPALGSRYFPSLSIKPQTSYDVMIKEKPDNGFRIFVLGGSSAFGYPYGRNGAFSAFLKDRLDDYLPNRKVEIVNMAMCAVGSYSVRDIGLELLSYQPDALLIYAGHNEFYGALGVGSTEFISSSRGLVNFYLKLNRYKTLQLVRDVIKKVKSAAAKPNTRLQQKRLMEHMAGDKAIPINSELFLKARNLYRENIKDLIRQANKKGIPVFAGELVSNVRDIPPFHSFYQSAESKKQSEKLFENTRRLLAQKEFDMALKEIQQAARIDSQSAQFHFLKARCLEGLGKINQARENYIMGKDLDGLRFRAPEVLNQVLKDLAKQNQLNFVPLIKIFESASPKKIIGNSLMTDHLHPNVSGYFLMGKSFFHSIQQNYRWRKNEQFGSCDSDSVYWYKSGITALDLAEANFRIQILTNSWPFKDSVVTIENVNRDKNNLLHLLAISVIKEEKTWEQAKVELAQSFIRNRNFENALWEYESLIKLTPYNSSPYIQAAKIHMHQRRFEQAAKLFKKSLQIEPTVIAYQGIGEAFFHQGQPGKSLPFLDKALSMEKNNPLTLFLLAKSLYRAGDLNQSIQYVEKLSSINPNFPGLNRLKQNLRKNKF
ncbi:hypothetical protein B6I21_06565 [candidate division KSB1 bacterium 4572_119]|nr:MAG: hypothetical protein B6I21_06565 [candidate division KSB1 bacterium 4572_119]